MAQQSIRDWWLKMQRDDIILKIRELMEETFGLDDLTVDDSTSAQDILEWDSLSHIRLMIAVEMAFAVKFSAIELTGFENVGHLVDAIIRKRQA